MTTYSLFLAYLAAIVMNTVGRAWATILDPLHAVTSWRAYFRAAAFPVGLRFLLCTGFFVWWWHDPSLVSTLFDKIGGTFSDPLRSIIMGIEFPLNFGTAMIYGVCCDSALDKLLAILGVRNLLPRRPGDAP